MGKYNAWALSMDREFKEARKEHIAAYKRYQTARKVWEQANKWREGDNDHNRMQRIGYAKLEFQDASNSLDAVAERVWNNFYEQLNKKRADLVRNVQSDNVVNPNTVDNNALELMKLGVLSAADYVAWANQYAQNSTMLRLIAHYAAEAAKSTDDKKEAATLQTVSFTCKDGLNATVRAWDELASIAIKCSGGRADGQRVSHDVFVNMAEKWEELSGDAIKNF